MANIDIKALCDELLSKLPEECRAWSGIIKDEMSHVLHSSTHTLGLVHQDEVDRLRKQISVLKSRISKLEVLINQLDEQAE